jgi:VWFA-related protein
LNTKAAEVLVKKLNPTLFFLSCLILLFLISVSYFSPPIPAQTRDRKVTTGEARQAPIAPADVIKVDVDLVVIDALVMQRNTARVLADLKRDDFVLFEDGTRQAITHFSQDTLPLSVLLLIDRGGCLDPFGAHVRQAATDAISRLKPADEVAVMTYHNTVELIEGFTRNRKLIDYALSIVPPHDEEANHCLNKAISKAADYMEKAANPTGRRVVILITGVTRNFDCVSGPSGKEATRAIVESGSVVCGIIPKSPDQVIENGVMIWATRMGHLGGAPYLDIQTLANETGGEILEDKPEKLDTTFNTLVSHLRTRYALGFVSSNKKRDGSVRKLKLGVTPAVEKTQGKIVVKARRSYVAPKG